ncbi:MAG: hypothetical protein FWE62_01775 [Firmicutes bacterium]|nr:hypothetical protein [Bacillota bacterium]
MKKKILAIILILAALLSACGCFATVQTETRTVWDAVWQACSGADGFDEVKAGSCFEPQEAYAQLKTVVEAARTLIYVIGFRAEDTTRAVQIFTPQVEQDKNVTITFVTLKFAALENKAAGVIDLDITLMMIVNFTAIVDGESVKMITYAPLKSDADGTNVHGTMKYINGKYLFTALELEIAPM